MAAARTLPVPIRQGAQHRLLARCVRNGPPVRNKDGSTVSYLQLAHNERHPETGSPVAKVIHNFGRADKVDREALTRLVLSISRVLDVTVDGSGVSGGDVEIVDSRRLGGTFVLDRMWERLGIG